MKIICRSGLEFNFINEMSIISEKNNDCCNSALEFNVNSKITETEKPSSILENKGFFLKII